MDRDMESKEGGRLVYDKGIPDSPTPKRHIRWRWTLAALCSLYIVFTVRKGIDSLPTSYRPVSYIQGGIEWTSCGENIECGRLDVPLDYFNISSGNASLALARYPATNKSARLGTLLTNPGGPGGSGVNLIHLAGKSVSDVLEGRYDIVSWDPRGINGTLPRVECFESQTQQDIFFANTPFVGGLRLADVRNAVYARRCHEVSGEALKYVSTATVVRDLVQLYEQLEGTDSMVNFWGFSYGTIVGSYLVNMFPDRVGKVVIDGVVNPDIWANTNPYTWLRGIFVDTEKDLHNFYSACAKAGPGYCALASSHSTAQSISFEVDSLMERLYERPVAVWNATRPGPLTTSMIQTLIFSYLYRPRDWPTLASNFAAAIAGNGVPIVEYFLQKVELNTTVSPYTAAAHSAVICTDTPPFSDEIDLAQVLNDVLREMELSQRLTSRHFSTLLMSPCQHWNAQAVERFTGPFNHTLKNEILIIGNTADPVTPLRNARAVNKMMPQSSRLIVQNGSGHCSFALASLCTGNALRAYFLEGKLPENGLWCEVDEVLFPSKYRDAGDVEGTWLNEEAKSYSEDELSLLTTLRDLGKELEPFVAGLP